jgi:hypothetical protein
MHEPSSISTDQLADVCGGGMAMEAAAGCALFSTLTAPAALVPAMLPGAGPAVALGIQAASCVAGAGFAVGHALGRRNR